MSKLRRYEVVIYALKLIKQNNGKMRASDIFSELEKTFPKSDYELEETSSGTPRWKNWLSFYSSDAAKSGFLVKYKGVWHITEEGENALKLPLEEFRETVKKGYKLWYDNYKNNNENAQTNEDDNNNIVELEVVQSQASKGIRDYIMSKNPYEFQYIVAALLRAMGYYTPFIAPKGKDGGIDIVAYRDPLGTSLPHIKVQVKHYPTTPINVDIVRSLIGVLAKDGEMGVIVTSGTFTSEAIRAERSSHTPIRLIDIDEFISLWIKYYPDMVEADKNLLPITPVYFINPENN